MTFDEIQTTESAYESARARGLSVEAAQMAAKLEFLKQRGARVRQDFKKARIAEQIKAAMSEHESGSSALRDATPEQRRAAVALLEKRAIENIIFGPEPTPGGPADAIIKVHRAMRDPADPVNASPLVRAALAKAKSPAITDQIGEAADALREAVKGLPAEIQNVVRAALGQDDSAARIALGFLNSRFPKIGELVRAVRASEDADKLTKSATTATSPLVRAASARAAEILKTYGGRP